MNTILLRKLSSIQSKMDISKNGKNEFANFKYRSIDSILNILKPLLNELDMMVIFRDFKYDEEKVYLNLNLIDLESETEEIINGELKIDWAKGKMDKCQMVLSAKTFLKKTLLEDTFFINESEDPDGHNNVDKPKNTTPEPPKGDYKITDKQVKYLMAMATRKGLSDEAIKKSIKKQYDIESKKDLLKSQFDSIITYISSLPDKKVEGGDK
jgi:hypothetical protein